MLNHVRQMQSIRIHVLLSRFRALQHLCLEVTGIRKTLNCIQSIIDPSLREHLKVGKRISGWRLCSCVHYQPPQTAAPGVVLLGDGGTRSPTVPDGAGEGTDVTV